ncbi:FAD-dependent oxidoreductase [uncultured Pseudomonas sp.]|uniref:FAD-dependent oxidoreductase n=1 Tax=uncultured Pseudomonas sp. TaxID=114707 RepID=UPI00258B2701|nr:FAD-dependent oxidoreductase [uncultured Pseudomonas sp.]
MYRNGFFSLAFHTLFIAFIVAPLVVVMAVSFTGEGFISLPSGGLSLRWFEALWANQEMVDAFWLSLKLGLVSATVATLLAVPAALAISRYDFPGRGAITGFLMSPLMIPSVVLGIAFLRFFSLAQVGGSLWALSITHVIVVLPYATPYRVVTAVRQAAERLGVVLHEQTPALSVTQRGTRWQVETRKGKFEADQLVVTAGAWAGRLAAEVGEPVPTYPQGLMLMVTHRVAPFCRQVLGATGRALSFKQFDNGTVVIGGKLIGALDFEARHGEVDIARLVTSAQTVTDLFPHLRHLGINRAWSGIEAFTEDDLPVISSSSRASGLTYSFGYCGSGFQMSLGTGQRVAQLVLGESLSIDLAAFAIDRFHRDSSTPRPVKEPICNPLPVSKPTSA